MRALPQFAGLSGPMETFFIPDGDAGVTRTIQKMIELVQGPKGIGSAFVRAAAIDAARGSVRNVSEIDRIFQWVKNNIEFRGEAEETLQSPEATLRLGAGDCDDHAMLLNALLGSLGYEWDFKTVGVARDSPGTYTHVYAMVQDKISGKWIPLDTTVSRSFAGWEPADITRETMYRAQNRFGRLGQDETASLISQTLQEAPALIAAGAGGAASVTTAAGTTSIGPSNPSIAGALSSASTSNVFFWLLIVGGAIAVIAAVSGGGRR